VTSPDPAPARIPDSHKSAFWIYGVTAMVMREPLSVFVKDLSSAGPSSLTVQLEWLRLLVVFLFLSRQFLAAGVFFDRVYLQPDSAARFPRRSYPVDFITRMIELLVAVAASTAVGIHTRQIADLAPFTILTVLLLLLQPVWLAVARLARYSTVPEIAPSARANFFIFMLAGLIYVVLGALHLGPAKADAASLTSVIILISIRLTAQIQSYGQSPGGQG
jgi:hypothetical protein